MLKKNEIDQKMLDQGWPASDATASLFDLTLRLAAAPDQNHSAVRDPLLFGTIQRRVAAAMRVLEAGGKTRRSFRFLGSPPQDGRLQLTCALLMEDIDEAWTSRNPDKPLLPIIIDEANSDGTYRRGVTARTFKREGSTYYRPDEMGLTPVDVSPEPLRDLLFRYAEQFGRPRPECSTPLLRLVYETRLHLVTEAIRDDWEPLIPYVFGVESDSVHECADTIELAALYRESVQTRQPTVTDVLKL